MRDGVHIKKRKNIFNKLQPFAFFASSIYMRKILYFRGGISYRYETTTYTIRDYFGAAVHGAVRIVWTEQLF